MGTKLSRQPLNNRATVLQLLRRHHGLARAEIAQRSALSEASVSRIAGQLIRSGLISQDGTGRSTGGRPAIRLQLDEKRGYSIGVDIQSWETRVSVGVLSGRILESMYLRTPSQPLKTLDAVAEQVDVYRRQFSGRRLEGIGVSTRGLVNVRGGVVERGHERAWTKIPVRDYLQSRLQAPVYVENNVRSAAFAEYHYGSLDVRDAHCLLFVKVDEGLGTSMLHEGEIFYGQHMAAGEFGQMVIAATKSAATHDRPGCLEGLAAGGALIELYQRLKGAKRSAAGGDVTARVEQICHRALHGDEAAMDALRQTARYLGIGISNLVWGLDPDAVVIDGPITEAWSLISPVIKEHFADGREFLNFRGLVLRPSALRGRAAIIGAAALPFQELFSTAEHATL